MDHNKSMKKSIKPLSFRIFIRKFIADSDIVMYLLLKILLIYVNFK